MPETLTPTPAPVPTSASSSEPPGFVPVEEMTADERAAWRVSGTYPDRPAKPADDAPATDTPAVDAAPDGPEQEADSPRPDTDVSEAARTLRRNRAEERKAKIQREINDLVARRAREQEQLEALEARRKTLDPSPSSPPAPTAPPASAGTAEPNINDFADFADYQRALTAYIKAEVVREQESARVQAAREASQREAYERRSAHDRRVEQARQRYADFDAVITAPDLPNLPQAVLDVIVASDNGPELMYALAHNAERIRKIASLPPVLAVADLGRFAAELEVRTKAPAPKPRTSAPPPPPVVGDRPGSPTDEVMDAAMSGDFTRYRDLMNAQQRAAGRTW
jgi:hypothetical protein